MESFANFLGQDGYGLGSPVGAEGVFSGSLLGGASLENESGLGAVLQSLRSLAGRSTQSIDELLLDAVADGSDESDPLNPDNDPFLQGRPRFGTLGFPSLTGGSGLRGDVNFTPRPSNPVVSDPLTGLGENSPPSSAPLTSPPEPATDFPASLAQANTPGNGQASTPQVTSSAAANLNDGLVLHWLFDEGSGGTAYDASGHGRNGIIDATWTTGKINGALDFQGGSHVDENNAASYLNGLNTISVSTWVKADRTHTNLGFFATQEYNSDHSDDSLTIRYAEQSSNRQKEDVIQVVVRTNEGKSVYESVGNVHTTDWQHITLTWQSGQDAKLYVNGQLDIPTSQGLKLGGSLSGITKLIVGKGLEVSESWDGKIDDFRLYDRVLSGDEIRLLADQTPPTIQLGLLNDTGLSNTDGLTKDPTVHGTIVNDAPIVDLQGRLGSTGSYTNLLANLEPDGDFTLSKTQLDAILGQALPNGTHTLELLATDANGNVGNAALTFNLDTLAPSSLKVSLASGSDSLPTGDRQTEASLVTLTGKTEAGATVTLNGTSLSTIANTSGQYNLTNVPLKLGQNKLTVKAQDGAGNAKSASITITRVADTTPPVLTARLLSDTGVSTSDRITSDPTLQGTLTEYGPIATFEAQLAGQENWVNVLGTLSGTNFTLDRTLLNTVAGGQLADGTQTVNLRAVNEAGLTAATSVTLTLDSLAPELELDTPISDGLHSTTARLIGDIVETGKLLYI